MDLLARRSLDGFLWLLGQTVTTRLVNVIGQLILARLLEPSDFGFIALAYGVREFALLTQRIGADRILVSRQREFLVLANPTFWLSSTGGLVGAGVLLIVAPFVARIYTVPELTIFLMLLAITVWLESLKSVPAAKLAIDLRFASGGWIATVSLASQMLLTVVLAALGLGVYSFVLPTLVVLPLEVIVLFVLTSPPIRLRSDSARWRSIFGTSGLLWLTALAGWITEQGDCLILGVFYSTETVGTYFLALTLSLQVVGLLSNNFANIIFPTLSRLTSERERREIFFRCTRLLAVVVFPLSLLLAALASPLIRLLYTEKWAGAVEIVQILAFGMAFRAVGYPAGSYLHAQGQFGRYAVYAVIRCALFFAVVVPAAPFGLRTFATAVAVSYVIAGLLSLLWSFGLGKAAIRLLVRTLALPLAASLGGMVLVLPIAHRTTGPWYWMVLIMIGAATTFVVVTMGLIRWWDRELSDDVARLKTLFRQNIGGGSAAVGSA